MTPPDAEKTSTKDGFESELHRSNEGLTLETSAFLPLRWLIYIFNPVVNNKYLLFKQSRRLLRLKADTSRIEAC